MSTGDQLLRDFISQWAASTEASDHVVPGATQRVMGPKESVKSPESFNPTRKYWRKIGRIFIEFHGFGPGQA